MKNMILKLLKLNKISCSIPLLSIFVLVVIVSCNKLDNTNLLQKNKVETFFTLPKNASSQVIRIVDELKNQHELTGFISTIINKEGFALWNNAKFKITSQPSLKTGREISTTNAVGDSLVYIPLVLENTEKVNSVFIARFNSNGLSIALYRGREYEQLGFGNLLASTANAEKFAFLLMQMEYEIFGHSEFVIKDYKLYNPHGTQVPDFIPQDKHMTFTTEQNGVLRGCISIVFEHCPYGVNCNNGGPCDLCNECAGSELICYSDTEQTQFDPPIPDPPSGGGGGGGPAPPSYPPGGPYPCNPNPLIINGLIPCEEGNTTGWTYLSTTVISCDPYITTLKNDTYFKSIFSYLNGSSVIGLDVETGFLIDRAVTPYTQVTGTDINNPTITCTLPPGSKYDGFLHSHNCPNPPTTCAASIFSPQDILFMAQVFRNGMAKDSNNLFMGITNSTGNPYLIKISNTAKFRIFAENLLADDKSQKAFFNKYIPRLRSSNADTNEENFLVMLKEMGVADGIDVFRGNTTCDTWTKISLSPFGSVSENICH